MERKCLCCGKELNSRQKKYCSYECTAKHLKEQRIQDWKEGKIDGLSGKYQLSSFIRNYMLEKANFQCERCGWNKINPVTGKSPLEVHHKDGNYRNNKEENLEVLCPNCHSLTPNYKALNAEGRKERTGESRKHLCVDCGAPISNGATRCRSCEGKKRTSENLEQKITREELKNLIRTVSFVEIGKRYGVSDNAVKKWCKRFNLPSLRKEIKAYTDEEWELL